LIELTARRSLTPVGAHVLVAIVRRPAGEHFLVFPQHESEVTLHAPSTALRLRSGKVSHGRRAPQPRRSSQTTGGEYERTARAL